MSDDLKGQVAVVTGGGRGFGQWIARGLAEAGAAVVVTARTKAQLDETVSLVETDGGRALAVAGDVTKLDDMLAVRDAAEREFGTVTYAIHNAGVPWPFGPTWYVDPARWWAAQEVHVLGGMHTIKAFVPGMIEHGGGHVVLVTSIAGVTLSPNLSGYSVAKSTQIRLAQFLGAEGEEHNVFGFSIHPGDELTELSEITKADPDAQKYFGWFVDRLNELAAIGDDPTPGFRACADLCVKLGSGRYDKLNGRYLTPTDDLDELLKQPVVREARVEI